MFDCAKAYGNMQAEIYAICRELFIPCFVEVQTQDFGRPDCVLVVNGQKIIVECKKSWVRPKCTTKQMRNYFLTGLPIVLLQEKDNLLHAILAIYETSLAHKIYIMDGYVLKECNTFLNE